MIYEKVKQWCFRGEIFLLTLISLDHTTMNYALCTMNYEL